MLLNEANSKFAVVKTSGHDGGTVCFSNSLTEAYKKAKRFRMDDCICGCCDVVPITDAARKEMPNYYQGCESIRLYSELPEWGTGAHLSYSDLCR